MGTAKAALEWHGSTLLGRTLGVLARSVDGPLVVVRAAGQPLPEISSQVELVDDPVPGRGPLQGIAAGLAALAGRAPKAFVCSTDLPFLHPAFVRRVLAALIGDLDVVLPVALGYPQPLAAAYRITLAPLITELVTVGERRLTLLFSRCATLRVADAELLADSALAAADPALDSLINVNSPDEYRAARRRLPPQVTVQCGGELVTHGHGGPSTVRAATVSGAAAAVGLPRYSRLTATLNGQVICHGGDIPLVTGDTIVFSGHRRPGEPEQPDRGDEHTPRTHHPQHAELLKAQDGRHFHSQ